jgi:hypothetical protein
MEGISELKSEIKSKVGYELQLEYSQETEEEYPFTAPKCARVTFQLHQLMRRYLISYRDNRFWLFRWMESSKDFDSTTLESTERMYDATTPPEYDPDCSNYNPGCRRELGKREKRDGIINLIFDGFGLYVHHRLIHHISHLLGQRVRGKRLLD